MKSERLIHIAIIVAALAAASLCHYFPVSNDGFFNRYGGNFFFPFAVYFIIRFTPVDKSAAALIALGGVYLQELGQLFGLYSGTFDFLDLVADLLGVLAAVGLESLLHKSAGSRVESVH